MSDHVYYHVAGPSYVPGQPLFSWNQRFEFGDVEAYEYRWTSVLTAECVSFFSMFEEAVMFAKANGGSILKVHLTEGLESRDADGYPAVLGMVTPAKVEVIPGHTYPYFRDDTNEDWEKYNIQNEEPEFLDDDAADEVIIRVFQASDGLWFYCEDLGGNDTSVCDGYATAYRATGAAIEHFRDRGERIRYMTKDACEKAACELGVAVELSPGRYLVPHKLIPKLKQRSVASL